MTGIARDIILSDVAAYYSDKLAQHGENARGVDWNGEESQTMRFAQLCKIIPDTHPFSINDLGCGYGALFDFLTPQYKAFSYSGIDISQSMIYAATRRLGREENVRFILAGEPDRPADYGVASGIFNLRVGRSDSQWWEYLKETLDALNLTSRRGFAFNCLTSYSDADKMRGDLYYADPLALFDFCKRNFSRDVALLHDYRLYEFTILVRM